MQRRGKQLTSQKESKLLYGSVQSGP